MGPLLFIVLIVVPLMEIATFIAVGDVIGLWPTVGTVVLTALIGAAMLRRQGLTLMTSAWRNLDRGVFPVREVFDGVCLVLAGALLLTPGFLTDGIGFALLIPPLRAALAERLRRLAEASGRVNVHGSRGTHGMDAGRAPHDPTIIDGEFHEVRPEEENADPLDRLPPKSGPGGG